MTSSPTTIPHISIGLSRDELFVVMRLLRAEAIPGFELSWVSTNADGTIAEPVKSRLESATESLIARGYLSQQTTDDGQIQLVLPEHVLALVGACAYGNYSLLMAMNSQGERKQIYLHELQEVGVVHSLPYADIHQFEALNGRPAVLAVVDLIAQLNNQQAIGFSEVTISPIFIQAAHDMVAAKETEEAKKSLIQGGFNGDQTGILIDAIQQSIAQGLIAIARRNEQGETEQATISLIVTPATCLMITAATGDQSQVTIASVGAEAVRQWAQELLK